MNNSTARAVQGVVRFLFDSLVVMALFVIPGALASLLGAYLSGRL